MKLGENKTGWVNCLNCGKNISKELAENQKGLCTECYSKYLYENLSGGLKK